MKRSGLWVGLYAALIIGLSSVPGNIFPDLQILSYDKLIHLVEYAILGYLLSWTVASRVAARSQIMLITLLLAGTFGALDETYQLLIPGRDFSYGDWVADLLGILAGSGAYLVK